MTRYAVQPAPAPHVNHAFVVNQLGHNVTGAIAQSFFGFGISESDGDTRNVLPIGPVYMPKGRAERLAAWANRNLTGETA